MVNLEIGLVASILGLHTVVWILAASDDFDLPSGVCGCALKTAF